MELDHLFQKDPCQTHIHVTLDDTARRAEELWTSSFCFKIKHLDDINVQQGENEDHTSSMLFAV